MLEKYHKLKPKPETIAELKVNLLTTWKELSQDHINKAAANFTEPLTACAAANGQKNYRLSLPRCQIPLRTCRISEWRGVSNSRRCVSDCDVCTLV